MGLPLIAIALPTGQPLKDGRPPERAIKFATNLQRLLPDHEILVKHSRNPREAHAVNILIEEFRNHPRGVWFVWWNFSVLAKAEDLVKLLRSGQAVCGAITTVRNEPDKWDAGFYPDILPDENELLPVPELGGNLKVYHRDVFDILERKNPNLAYIYDNSGRSVFGFCQEVVVQFGEYRRLVSPANYLDKLCREAGLGIWAHAGVVLQRKAHDGKTEPEKEPYRSWLFTREPPPICAEELPEAPKDDRPIKVYIQYWEKDRVQAQRLYEAIRGGSHHVELIESEGGPYPDGPNKTAIRLMRIRHFGVKAVLLLEPDCCPMTPDWLEQLSESWDRARAAGKLIMGSWHPINVDHPTLGHLNGNLMFEPGFLNLFCLPFDVPKDKPWDTWLADLFAPYWCRTGLIKNLNRHKTATVKQLTLPECGTRSPVLIHGVRDESAWNLSTCVPKSSA